MLSSSSISAIAVRMRRSQSTKTVPRYWPKSIIAAGCGIVLGKNKLKKQLSRRHALHEYEFDTDHMDTVANFLTTAEMSAKDSASRNRQHSRFNAAVPPVAFRASNMRTVRQLLAYIDNNLGTGVRNGRINMITGFFSNMPKVLTARVTSGS
ncbi:hypothetical protein CC80DRAFT_594358 [Byssothecium circinans]|uniref:Uncharacterized protein n=1 Tax=Byssothecium circinans TaxID=147558 RepID=A0A6A5TRX3_9PLEO|nr:hypothetical protein CC80DRAFT_594358 [Byssothecium circinans]